VQTSLGSHIFSCFC